MFPVPPVFQCLASILATAPLMLVSQVTVISQRSKWSQSANGINTVDLNRVTSKTLTCICKEHTVRKMFKCCF